MLCNMQSRPTKDSKCLHIRGCAYAVVYNFPSMILHAYRTARHAHAVISILGTRSAGLVAMQLFFGTNNQPTHNPTRIGLPAVRMEAAWSTTKAYTTTISSNPDREAGNQCVGILVLHDEPCCGRSTGRIIVCGPSSLPDLLQCEFQPGIAIIFPCRVCNFVTWTF